MRYTAFLNSQMLYAGCQAGCQNKKRGTIKTASMPSERQRTVVHLSHRYSDVLLRFYSTTVRRVL